MSSLATGDVIREEDDRGRVVTLWLVVQVELHAVRGIVPQKVRRACRPKAAVEIWDPERHWARSTHAHRFALPPEAK